MSSGLAFNICRTNASTFFFWANLFKKPRWLKITIESLRPLNSAVLVNKQLFFYNTQTTPTVCIYAAAWVRLQTFQFMRRFTPNMPFLTIREWGGKSSTCLSTLASGKWSIFSFRKAMLTRRVGRYLNLFIRKGDIMATVVIIHRSSRTV